MIINVCGVMGVGKTTACELLSKELGLDFIQERFEDNPYWRECYSGTGDFFKMQIAFLTQYLQNIEAVKKEAKSYIVDNQFFAGLAFTKSLFEQGKISKKDFDTYGNFFNALKMRFYDKDVFNVFLFDTPENIFGKIKKRGRLEERSIQIEFIKCLCDSWEPIVNDNEFIFLDIQGENQRQACNLILESLPVLD